MNEHIEAFDFSVLGEILKKARKAQEITREELAEQLDITPRHLQAIENEGQHPGFQLFVQLIRLFDISVDQYLFPNKTTKKSSLRRQTDSLLDTLNDKDLSIVNATARAISKAKDSEA